MKFWLASSDINEIERLIPSGVFAGVVTNPKIVADSGKKPADFIGAVAEICPVWHQVRDAESPDTMLKEAETMLNLNSARVMIKVPMIRQGYAVLSRLVHDGQTVMATCVPTSDVMVLAVAAGASVVAPFSSMLQKRGILNKPDDFLRFQQILDAQGSDAELLAGLYDITDISIYARNGIKSAFFWGKDAEKFLDLGLAREAVDGFKDSWETIENY